MAKEKINKEKQCSIDDGSYLTSSEAESGSEGCGSSSRSSGTASKSGSCPGGTC